MSFSGIPARITADIGSTGGLALDSSVVSVEGAIDSMSAKLPAALGRQTEGASLSAVMCAEDRTTSLAILADLDKFTFVATRLQVDAVVSSDIQIGAVEIKNATTDDRVVVRTDGVEMAMVVSQNSQPLPTGASTSAKQDATITAIGAVSAKLPTLGQQVLAASLSVVVASDQVVPISATALPLPTGASTSANQATANISLGSIDGKMNALGQKASTGSMPVVIASDQTPVAISAASLPLPAGASTAANQATANVSLASIDGKLTTTANGLKVDGSAVTQPVSAVALPLPAGASTSANQTTANVSLASIDGKLATLGQKAMAGSLPVVLSSDQTGIQPNTDLTSSGTIVALSGTVVHLTHGCGSAMVSITGTWTASLQIQGLAPDGATWTNLAVTAAGAGVGTFSSAVITANGVYRCATAGGFSAIRVISTAFTSGPVAVNILTSSASATIGVIALNPANLNVTQAQAYYATNGLMFSVDVESINLAVAGAFAPIAAITNSGTKNLLVNIWKGHVVTTNRSAAFQLLANPTTVTGGSAVTVANNSMGNATATTATVVSAPTITGGTAMRSDDVGLSATGFVDNIGFSVVIPPTKSIVIMGNPSANNTVVTTTIQWAEVPV